MHAANRMFWEYCGKAGGMGEVCLVAFKDRILATGEPQIDQLLEEDIADDAS